METIKDTLGSIDVKDFINIIKIKKIQYIE